MGERLDGQPAHAALKPSLVRRWRVDGPSAEHGLEQVTHSQAGQEWAPHWHEEWSVGAVLAGRCHFVLAGQKHSAGAGDVLAIAPSVVHTCVLDRNNEPGSLVLMVYAPTDWLNQLGVPAPAASALLHAPALARSAGAVHSVGSAAEWVAQALPALARGSGALPAQAPPEGRAGRQVLQALQRAAAADVPASIDQLADACSVSREHFHRVTTRWLGVSPGDYLRAARMSRARRLLLGGESIAEAALACGFADQAHFTRWFRRCFGYTPGALLQAETAAGVS